jgi:glycosyltransferase involved in cell wall biosynthesis
VKTLRVLRIITRLNVGGPAMQAILLTARLPRRYSTTLVVGREGRHEGNMLALGRSSDRVSPVVVSSLVREVSPRDDVTALIEVLRLARRFRPDIVHTHLANAGLIGRIAGRLAGARAVVHTFHGTVFEAYFGRRESSLYLSLERILARLTSRIIAITPLQKEHLIARRVAPANKIAVIPLGLDLQPFLDPPDREAARRSFEIPDGTLVVAVASRLVPVKDVATFLRAFGEIASDQPAVALIAGDGPERERLETLARNLGIAGRCRFLGWRANMPEFYSAADVVALSSLNEGSPVSLIEAMAAAKPVVATAVGGVPDVVVDGASGLLVHPGDAAAFGRALSALLDDAGIRTAFGRRGREIASPRFGIERLLEDMDRLYDELTA